MSNAPSWTLVREKADELKTKILSKFPTIDVEYVDWRDLSRSEGLSLKDGGFPTPHPDVHAYMLIRGDLETAEEAATLADNEVARISEESGVEIQVQKTNRVWCKKSEMLVAWSVQRGQELAPTSVYRLHRREGKRGVTFLCWWTEPHEHEWGRLKPED